VFFVFVDITIAAVGLEEELEHIRKEKD